jgi:hypothetical protein
MTLADALRPIRISLALLQLLCQTPQGSSLRSLGRRCQGDGAARPGGRHVRWWGAYAAQARFPLGFSELVVAGQQHKFTLRSGQVAFDSDGSTVNAPGGCRAALVADARPDARALKVYPPGRPARHGTPHTHGGVGIAFFPAHKCAVDKCTPRTKCGHR